MWSSSEWHKRTVHKHLRTCKVQTESVAEKIAPIAATIKCKQILRPKFKDSENKVQLFG